MEGINVTDFIEPGVTALLISLLIGAVMAFAKGWVVPRFIYDRAVERGDKLLISLEDMSKSLDNLTSEIRRK